MGVPRFLIFLQLVTFLLFLNPQTLQAQSPTVAPITTPNPTPVTTVTPKTTPPPATLPPTTLPPTPIETQPRTPAPVVTLPPNPTPPVQVTPTPSTITPTTAPTPLATLTPPPKPTLTNPPAVAPVAPPKTTPPVSVNTTSPISAPPPKGSFPGNLTINITAPVPAPFRNVSANTTLINSTLPTNTTVNGSVALAPAPGPLIQNQTIGLAPGPQSFRAPAPAPFGNQSVAPGPSPPGGNTSVNTSLIVPSRLQPANSSQLFRDLGGFQSKQSTTNVKPQFSTLEPPNQGTVLQVPAQMDFTNRANTTVLYQLDGPTGELCGPTCVAFCQVDDGDSRPCSTSSAVAATGAASATAATGALSDGYHRLTVRFFTSPSSLQPIAVHSTFFVVDTVPPTVSVALQAEDGVPRVFAQTRDGQPTLFVFWDSLEPCPGIAVLSEPLLAFGENAFLIEGGFLAGLRRDDSVINATGAAARRLLQATDTVPGVVGYRFQIVPFGLGPSLLRVSVKPEAADRAANRVQITQESQYTLYFDASRPSALLQQVVTSASGVTSLQTTPGLTSDTVITMVIDFNQTVYGFNPGALIIQNGTLISFGPEEAIRAGASSYILTLSVNPLTNLRVSAPDDIAHNAVGHGSTASNELQVLNYAKNANLQTGIRATAAASVGVVVTGTAFTATSVGFLGVLGSLTTFAARQNLQTPLPAPYLDASSALSFTLFDWPSPLDRFLPRVRALAAASMVPANSTLGAAAPTGEARNFTSVDGTSVPVQLTVLSRAAQGGLPPTASVEAQSEMYKTEVNGNGDSGQQRLVKNAGNIRALVRAVFWVLAILVLMAALHTSKTITGLCLRRQIAPTFLAFPGPELMLLTFATLPLAFLAVRAITGGSSLAITLGTLVLISIASLFAFLAAVIWKHVVQSKSVAFVPNASGDASRFSWFRAPVNGTWQPADPLQGALFAAKYAYFYGDFAGRPSRFEPRAGTVDAEVRGPAVSASNEDSGDGKGQTFDVESRSFEHVNPFARSESNWRRLDSLRATENVAGLADPFDRSAVGSAQNARAHTNSGVNADDEKLEWGEENVERTRAALMLEEGTLTGPRRVHRFGRSGLISNLRPCYKLMYLVIVAVEISLLGATHGIRGMYWQVALSVSLRLLVVLMLMILRPFVDSRLQMVELFSASCELAVVLCALGLLVLQNAHPGRSRTTRDVMGYVMVGLQVAAVFVCAVNSCFTVLKKVGVYLRSFRRAS